MGVCVYPGPIRHDLFNTFVPYCSVHLAIHDVRLVQADTIYFRRVTSLRTGSPRVDISAQKPGVRDFSQYFQVPAGMAPHKPKRPPSTSFTVIQHSTLCTLWVAGSDVKATKYEVQLDYRPI